MKSKEKKEEEEKELLIYYHMHRNMIPHFVLSFAIQYVYSKISANFSHWLGAVDPMVQKL